MLATDIDSDGIAVLRLDNALSIAMRDAISDTLGERQPMIASASSCALAQERRFARSNSAPRRSSRRCSGSSARVSRAICA